MDTTQSSELHGSATGTVEELSSGLTREWLYDGQIVVYTVKDVRRETIDAWLETFTTDIMNWPADGIFRVVHDLSIAGGITPYGRTRGQEMFNTCPEVLTWAALVLPDTFVNDLIRIFLRTQSTHTESRVRECFTTREDALKWLLR